ncbi:PorP/SprF family type IX secretion system membrane protein [Cellulophaga tyrosinoxydans]|uniref:Type IX secretion system membrane protein, PorP/SprF family n=1 Tax=Cellulophaga tyrosinoxydans TaxID=504486 RepID=A0A1W1Z9M7_9FLAO|nr:PorP/SprF family type IX secretion system membrane protein [Cellulophaga tyrosinoxydans]SMC44911.1 type IX secretion system membrane protein, PorP/SprF family [Cellulophaga tyrosinoxydans]
MNLKNNITVLGTIIFTMLGMFQCYAQQTPTFSEYNYNPFILNSAYAGLTANTELSVSNAGYFNDFEGSPRSFSLSGHGQLNRGKVGLGAGIIRDQIGVTTSTSFFGAYSYKIFFDFEDNRPYWQLYNPGVLSFGITAGVQQYQDNLLDLGIMDDPNFSENISATIPTIGLGFLFNHASFYVGFSAPNVLGDALASRDDLNLENPIYGYFGYRFFNNRFQDVLIKPNMLLKYEDGAPLQADINLAVSFKNKFEIGGGYRTSSSVNLLAGVYLFDSVRFIYNYNITTNDSPIGNTHGFVLSYQFGEGYKID